MVRSSLEDEGDRAQEPKKRSRTQESHNVRKEEGMKGEPREHGSTWTHVEARMVEGSPAASYEKAGPFVAYCITHLQ